MGPNFWGFFLKYFWWEGDGRIFGRPRLRLAVAEAKTRPAEIGERRSGPVRRLGQQSAAGLGRFRVADHRKPRHHGRIASAILSSSSSSSASSSPLSLYVICFCFWFLVSIGPFLVCPWNRLDFISLVLFFFVSFFFFLISMMEERIP